METKGSTDLQLASYSWLKNHYLAKASTRRKQLHDLPIKKGDRIIDLCCGPGFYSMDFASQCAPSGLVLGIDKDPVLIDIAEHAKKSSFSEKSMRFLLADANSTEAIDAAIDFQPTLIICFNALLYFNKKEEFLKKWYNILPDGGVLIIKDSDYSQYLLSPFDLQLQDAVKRAAFNDKDFDNFAGHKIYDAAIKQFGRSVSVSIWPDVFQGPLSAEEKIYVSTNLLTLGRQAAAEIDQKQHERWVALYDAARSDALIHTEHFLFVMHDIIVQITKSD